MVVFGDEIFHTMRNFLKKRDPFEPLKTSVSKGAGFDKERGAGKRAQTSRCYEKWSRGELLNVGEMVNSATNVSRAIAYFNTDHKKRSTVQAGQ